LFRTRPTLSATLAALAAFLVLLGLGTWQLQRLGWKQALIAERLARLAAPPLTLTAEDVSFADDLAHRRVRLTGRFLNDKEMYFGLRAVDGVPGLELLTPLELPGGVAVVVNRGWVPARLKEPERRPETRPDGPVDVLGILRPDNPSPSLFTPGNDPAVNRWYSYDTRAMADYLGLALAPFVVEASAEPGQRELPIGRSPTVDFANNHLQYALTWYGLALVLAVIFVLYHRRRDST